MMTTHTDMHASTPVSTCTHTHAQRHPRDALSVLLALADSYDRARFLLTGNLKASLRYNCA